MSGTAITSPTQYVAKPRPANRTMDAAHVSIGTKFVRSALKLTMAAVIASMSRRSSSSGKDKDVVANTNSARPERATAYAAANIHASGKSQLIWPLGKNIATITTETRIQTASNSVRASA